MDIFLLIPLHMARCTYDVLTTVTPQTTPTYGQTSL